MAILHIVYFPDDPLTKKAQLVTEFGSELKRLAEDMLETMHGYEGVGLAGPQVGVAQRIFVMQEPDGPEMCIVNPELSELEGEESGQEGCLSIPEVYADVARATQLHLRARDIEGKPVELEATDFLARIIQHENDHLNGVLFPERLDVLTRQRVLQEWSEVRERLLAEDPSAPPGHATR